MTTDQAHGLQEADVRDLYETDFYAWANEQVALLRAGRLAEADIANIAEEIESLGRSERRELRDRFIVLLTHLLKWQFQPNRRGRSWQLTVAEQRRQLADHLAANPSLRPLIPEIFGEAYAIALLRAQRQTGLSERVLPSEAPYSFEQAIDDDFWPQE